MPSEALHESASTTQSGELAFTAGRPRLRAVFAACAILVLPIGYLLSYYGSPRGVSAGTEPPAASSRSIVGTESTASRIPTAGNQINLSLAYIRGNQPGRAVPLLTSILAADPNNAVAWNNLCVAHTMLMFYNLAVQDCGRSLRIQPDFQLARNNLRWAASELQKAQQSIANQEKTALASRDANFYLVEGLNFLHIGGYGQAIKAWQRNLDLNPKDALAANNIGVAYMSMHQPGPAASWFRKAISIDPTMQLAKNNLAWASEELIRTAQ